MSVGTGGYELTVNDGGDLYKLLIDAVTMNFTLARLFIWSRSRSRDSLSGALGESDHGVGRRE